MSVRRAGRGDQTSGGWARQQDFLEETDDEQRQQFLGDRRRVRVDELPQARRRLRPGPWSVQDPQGSRGVLEGTLGREPPQGRRSLLDRRGAVAGFGLSARIIRAKKTSKDGGPIRFIRVGSTAFGTPPGFFRSG